MKIANWSGALIRPFCARLLAIAVAHACAAWADSARYGEQSAVDQSASWPGSELFANFGIVTIRLEINPQELAKLKNDSRAFVRAEVTEAGTVYSNVAVHLKGSVGSFRPLDEKPGFTLDFDRFQGGRRFHGIRRIHLNNSVEDPSYCNEQLGGELFRAAGIPAPRVTRAVVTLNQRRLGLYVLKEGFTEDFLSCYFKKIGGNLYEPGEGHDVNQHLKRTSIQAPAQNRRALKNLASAALEPDPQRRWRRLAESLETDSFIRFMATEIMLCHRDGYCLARNNFRLYLNVDSGRMMFMPQGMDQLLGAIELPWVPQMAGLVARAVIETPQGKSRYTEEFRSLFKTLFKPEVLAHRVDQLTESLRPGLSATEFENVRAQALLLKDRIIARAHNLELQLTQLPLPPLTFTNGFGLLENWRKSDETGSGQLDLIKSPGRSPCLHIVTSSDTSASWRTKALLTRGHYRFEGKVRVSDVRPLGFGTHQGAGLRIGGQTRKSDDLTGSSDWHLLAETFEVGQTNQEVEFVCELRASRGEAWFDCASLRIVQEP